MNKKNGKKVKKALNDLLQGEYIAVEAFNVFISKVKDERMRNTFQEIQNQHRENISTLANYIQNLGSKPNEGLGMKRIYVDLRLNVELYSKNDLQILTRAIQGEDQGINMAEKAIRGKLDDESRKLTGEILHRDRICLEKLKSLM